MALGKNVSITFSVDGAGKATSALGKIENKLGDVGKKTGRASKSSSKFTGALRNMSRTAAVAEGALGKHAGRLSALASAFDTVSGKGLLFGAAIGSITGILVKSASDGMAYQRMMNTLELATGDSAKAFEFLSAESDRLGFSLQESADAYAKLAAAAKGTSLEGEGVKELFSATMTAASALGMTVDQAAGSMKAFEQMLSKGNVQAEELRGQLGDRLVGAFGMAAKAMGRTTKELNKMLENGEVLAKDLLPAMAKIMNTEFGTAAERAAHNLQQELNRLSTAWFKLGVALAESGTIDLLAATSRVLQDTMNMFTEYYQWLNDTVPLMKEATDGVNTWGSEVDRLKGRIDFFSGVPLAGGHVKQLKIQLEEAKDMLSAYVDARSILMEGDDKENKPTGGGGDELSKAQIAADKLASKQIEFFTRQAEIASSFGKSGLDREDTLYEQKLAKLTEHLDLVTFSEKVSAEKRSAAISGYDKALDSLVEAHDRKVVSIKEAILKRETKMLSDKHLTFIALTESEEAAELLKLEREFARIDERMEKLRDANLLTADLQLSFDEAKLVAAQETADKIDEIDIAADERKMERLKLMGEAEAGLAEEFGNIFRSNKLVNLEAMSKDAIVVANSMKKFDEMTLDDKIDMTQKGLKMLSGMMDSENRKMFEIGKAAAIANTIISTITAANKVFAELPFPVAVVVSGLIAAAGAANVAKIASTKMGGGAAGGLGTSISSGGSLAPVNNTSIPPEQVQPSPQLTIVVETTAGLVDPIAAQQLADSLAPHIQDSFDRGMGVVVV